MNVSFWCLFIHVRPQHTFNFPKASPWGKEIYPSLQALQKRECVAFPLAGKYLGQTEALDPPSLTWTRVYTWAIHLKNTSIFLKEL